ncbi:hypothetical protein TNCV_3519901 [Trichonephila clavipes]|nr:hypothetical protein TNCV_3519901 [Trichonephila clavipes]
MNPPRHDRWSRQLNRHGHEPGFVKPRMRNLMPLKARLVPRQIYSHCRDILEMRCLHRYQTIAQNFEIRHQQPSCSFRVWRKLKPNRAKTNQTSIPLDPRQSEKFLLTYYTVDKYRV